MTRDSSGHRAGGFGREPWRETGNFGRVLFLVALVGSGVGAVEPFAARAVSRAAQPAVPVAAPRCQEAEEGLALPPGHPPISGRRETLRLPPGHPSIGDGFQSGELFPQDAVRTL